MLGVSLSYSTTPATSTNLLGFKVDTHVVLCSAADSVSGGENVVMSKSASSLRDTAPLVRPTWLASLLFACASLFWPWALSGETVAVRHAEGLVHGFLILRNLEGTPLADGDLIQAARGDRVTSRLVFHFRDGSIHDETVVYSQRRRFRLITHHLVQKGPTFPQPLEMSIDGSSGRVTVRYADENGEQKVATDRLDVPPDLANGLILTLLKNLQGGAPPNTVSFIAATPKPRLVKLAITAAGEERFSTGGADRKATHYVLRVEIGGIAGLVAPLLGKQPPDSHVWILGGEAPAFVRSEQPLYLGGPLWRIELVSPVWPRTVLRLRSKWHRTSDTGEPLGPK